MILDALVDACFDTLKLFPFLLVTYLFMEWLEHGAGSRFEGAIARGGRVGPLIGALLGVVPQCGFSGAAATLYAGRVVTLGTLIAVFLATSDEMLPIMISEAVPIGLVVQVLAVKVVTGIVAGFVLDAIMHKTGRLHIGLSSRRRHEGHGHNDIHELCEQEGCDCDDEETHVAEATAHESHDHDHNHSDGIVLPALKHSLSVTAFIFVITLILNVLVESGLEGALADIANTPYLSTLVMGLVGLIPNCAVSVAATELYLEGVVSAGALISGLCVNAGVGLLVLFRTNRDFNENLRVMLVLFAIGVIAGLITETFHLLPPM